MSEIRLNREETVSIIEKIINRTMQMDLNWDWEAGVAYYGICRAYDVLKNESYIEPLKLRIEELIELDLNRNWDVNKCAMGHCLITLYEATGDEKYWDLVMSKIAYLQHEALRFGDGVLQHTVSSGNDFPEQAWADTLFMAAFLMLRVAVINKDEELIDDALNQYYWHIEYLQDRKTGLFYHGYDHTAQGNLSGFYWGRANAWAAYTMSQVGARLPQAYLYPKFMDVIGSLSEQLSALKVLQTEDGLWRTILNDEESYEELSASAGIAAAMVVRRNPLHRKYIVKSIEGIKKNITEEGRVLNVSGGTAVMRDLAGYREISKNWQQGWGQGLALSFFSELLAAYE